MLATRQQHILDALSKRRALSVVQLMRMLLLSRYHAKPYFVHDQPDTVKTEPKTFTDAGAVPREQGGLFEPEHGRRWDGGDRPHASPDGRLDT
ncbi:hypothetical protein KQH49_08955 [Mycetohabitans sp. B5]|uniref:Uncharacterized protein n=1 Tax=Mycetohabitans endofungorum TaxID=417203 RepID=A0A2P5K716_9BURK|nr:hypothetical protein [Mycetohabitans sp. B5]PPB81438.1 hypothetical protein B0O95_11911 [Mycetohabitans endofungorum]